MKSIFSLIHHNLKKALLLSTTATAVALAVYSYFSVRSVKQNAMEFVMNHAVKLAEAGVNSQNVSDVDREIGRFASAWKETQDLDLRIDLFLDERLIAHAGQLQRFRFLYSDTKKEIKLASGQFLKALVQIDLRGFLLAALIQLAAFELFLFVVFSALMKATKQSIRKVTLPLEARVAWLKAVTQGLPESAKNPPSVPEEQIEEISDLGKSVDSLLRQIVLSEDHLSKTNFQLGRIKMADQVAHNIRGAIATLQLKMSGLSNLSESDRNEIVECLNSIRNVSDNLLKSKKAEQETDHRYQSSVSAIIHVMPPIVSAFEMKALQYREKAGIIFDYGESSKLYGVFAAAAPEELRTVVSNLVDNAVDAISSQGTVSLKVTIDAAKAEISIQDNGKGIPSDMLPHLFTDGFTFGKSGGNGIGLTHAREIVRAWGGSLHVQSLENRGSTFTITLRRLAPPASFVKEIALSKGAQLVVTDDDPVVHRTIKTRLNAAGLRQIITHHLTSVEDFERWQTANGYGEFGSRQYLFDFDLKDSEMNGLDLIEKHGLAMESLLVSGLADDTLVARRAAKIGVRRLSKSYLDVIPIVEEEVSDDRVLNLRTERR